MRRIRVVILFLFIAPGILQAQEVEWRIVNDPDEMASSIRLPTGTPDSVMMNTMRGLVSELHYQGYLSAAYGVANEGDSIQSGTLYIGPQFKWARLSPGNVPEVILSRAGYRPRDFEEKPFRLTAYRKLFDQVISYSENHGFPFASVRLDSVRIEEDEISGVLHYEPGPEIVFDSLRLQGFNEVKVPWLMSYLHLTPGTPFDQQSLDQLPGRIRQMNFMKIAGDPSLTFQNESARLYLPLEKVPSNRIDGIIGFLPNEENDGGIRITGQLDLVLTNLFNSGKELDVAWQRVKPLSQTLAIRYRHPNLFRSPIHFDGGFELLKEDSTFINRQFRLALAFTTGIHELGVFTQFKSTRLLSTSQYNDLTELPDLSDQNVNYYGLEYSSSFLQDGWADNKGWSIQAMGALGDKEIRRNSDIPEEVYEDVDLKNLQIMFELRAALGIQAGRRSLFYSRLHAGFVEDDQLFLNDMFRLGGLRSLRGFNENNFFASSFATVSVEYQLFFETFSYLFLFIDQGILENSLVDVATEYPTGFGLGLNLRTGGGDLQLAFALGRTNEQPVNFSLSKFHFGYVAKF